MNLQFKFLSAPYKHRTRANARSAYLAFPNDQEAAVKEASRTLRAEFNTGSIVTTLLIKVAISLAAKLIAHWIANRLLSSLQQESNPEVFQPGEPGA